MPPNYMSYQRLTRMSKSTPETVNEISLLGYDISIRTKWGGGGGGGDSMTK